MKISIPIEAGKWIVFAYLSLFTFSLKSQHLEGEWSGTFMDQFDIQISFKGPDKDIISGNLKMYANHQILQDDELTNVKIQSDSLSFSVPTKETLYLGKISQDKCQ